MSEEPAEPITLDNFDESATSLRFGTPRSTEACLLIGIDPTDLLKKSEKDFQGPRWFERAEKKRQTLLEEAQRERLNLNSEDGTFQLKSPSLQAERARRGKQLKMFEKRERALELKMQRDLENQRKIEETERKIKEAAENKNAALDIGGKHAKNVMKKQKHQEARELQARKQREKEEKLRQIEQDEYNKLESLGKKRTEEDKIRMENLEKRQRRYEEKTNQNEREKSYKKEMKQLHEKKRGRQVALDDMKRKQEREQKKFDREMIEKEQQERLERLKRQQDYKNMKKLEREDARQRELANNKAQEEKLRKQNAKRERMLEEQLNAKKEEFERKCQNVRNASMKDVQRKLKVLEVFSPSSKTQPVVNGSPSNKKPFHKAASASADGAEDLVLPPLASGGVFLTSSSSPKNQNFQA